MLVLARRLCPRLKSGKDKLTQCARGTKALERIIFMTAKVSVTMKLKNNFSPTAKRFIFNGLALTLAAIIMRTVSVSFNAYVSAKIGAEGIGLFTLTMSIYGFAVTLATSGVNLACTALVAQALARNDKNSALGALRCCILYSLIFGAATSLLLWHGARFIGNVLLSDARTVSCLRLLSVSMVPISLSSAFNGYFTAVRRVYKNACAQLFEQAVKIFLTVYALSVLLPRGLEYSCLALVGGGAVAEFISFFFLFTEYLFDRHRHMPERWKKASLPTPDMLAISLPVAFSAYARSALVTVEHILIPRMLSLGGSSQSQALASYGRLHSMSLPIIMYPMAAVSAFAGLLVPEFAEALTQKDDSRLSKMSSDALHNTLLFSVCSSGVLIAFSRELGTLIYSSHEVGKYIAMLAPLIPVMYLDHIVDAMLKGMGKQVFSMIVNITDSLLSIVLVCVILPRLGAEGYVYVIVIAEIFNFACSFTGLCDCVCLRFDFLRSLVIPLAAILSSVTLCRRIFVYSAGVFSLVARICFCVSVYALLVFVSQRLLPRKELSLSTPHRIGNRIEKQA